MSHNENRPYSPDDDQLNFEEIPFLDQYKLEEGIIEGIIPVRSHQGDYNLIFSTEIRDEHKIPSLMSFTFCSPDVYWKEEGRPQIGEATYTRSGQLVSAELGEEFGASSPLVSPVYEFRPYYGETLETSAYTTEIISGSDTDHTFDMHNVNNTMVITLDQERTKLRKTFYLPLILPGNLLTATEMLATHGQDAVDYLRPLQQQSDLYITFRDMRPIAPGNTEPTPTDQVLSVFWRGDGKIVKISD